MYDPVVLTLDGSELSELAMVHAREIARAFGARLILLRVVTPTVRLEDLDAGPGPYQQILDAELRAAAAYVERKAQELKAEGIAAEGTFRLGEPAASIVEFLAEKGAKLLVLSSHGRSGMSRWMFGSVADRVVRSSPVPVLLVRAQAGGE